MNYAKFIESRFKIINKKGEEVSFVLNPIQRKYLDNDSTGYDVILKARQQGFSSLILAIFAADFILKENSRSVIVADIADNATELLDRVKSYIKSYEEVTGIKVPLKYNSKYELYNEALDSRYTIGTADNSEFGRSKTITNLHLSEAAFYSHLDKIMAGAGTAVVENGRFIVETTANGFNEFRKFWLECKDKNNIFKPLFYKASDFYSPEFLEKEKLRLKDKFPQEYPEDDMEAFISSGNKYFDTKSLKWYLQNIKDPNPEGIYL